MHPVHNPIPKAWFLILRWTVDYPEDMEFVRKIYNRLIERNYWVFDQQSVLELLERAPELREINEDR
jgi:spore coat polysaccharide biosynthesis protein SpsF (cytidylyltransferase family)